MLENEKLRKADIFSAVIISLFGLWVVGSGAQDAHEGLLGRGAERLVCVSPALFPLFVGGMIVVLGVALTINALKDSWF